MKILKFIPEAPKGTLYLGKNKTFLPGIMGKFDKNLQGAAEEEVYGILMGQKGFEKGNPQAFEPIGFIKINDRGSHEYILVGVNAVFPPSVQKYETFMEEVIAFARANFIVGSYGGPEAAKRITDSLLAE